MLLRVDVDLGTVPSWLAAGSLLLAFQLFLRDRRNADRGQVDLMGAWATADYEHRGPTDPKLVVEATVQPYVRNASQLPIEVKQLAFEVHTTWLIPHGELSYRSVAGVAPHRLFIDDLEVAPQQTWDNSGTPTEVNLAHLAPEGAVQLSLVKGVRCAISWMLLIDNAGRKWEVRPGKGGRAKRIRWYHRPREHQPRKW